MEQEKKICIVDYGSGNINSVYSIFAKIHPNVIVSNSAEDLNTATHIVLPGVGAFGAAMEKLKRLSLIDILEENVLHKKKLFLGICVGMQILADKGYEHGEFDGLGWITGEVKKIDSGGRILPHVGWNNSKILTQQPLLEGITDEMDFYYVNSFHFCPDRLENIMTRCPYGEEFASIVYKDNIFGVQFHPEKSQMAGKKLIENFIQLT